MDISELLINYNFHDSLLKAIDYDEKDKSAELLIDFAFWAQNDYKDGSPETGYIKVKFYDVDLFDIPSEIDFDQVSILGTEMSNDCIKFMILNDFTDENFWLIIRAASVTIETNTSK